jgi:hypothetical protein
VLDADEVSDAVLVWSGYGETSWPARDEGPLVARYGEHRALDLLPLVKTLECEVYESDVYRTEADLAAVGRKAARQFRLAHPEVSDEAVDASRGVTRRTGVARSGVLYRRVVGRLTVDSDGLSGTASATR